MFRFYVQFETTPGDYVTLKVSESADDCLSYMWPCNVEAREQAKKELAKTGSTSNGPTTILDRQHKQTRY